MINENEDLILKDRLNRLEWIDKEIEDLKDFLNKVIDDSDYAFIVESYLRRIKRSINKEIKLAKDKYEKRNR